METIIKEKQAWLNDLMFSPTIGHNDANKDSLHATNIEIGANNSVTLRSNIFGSRTVQRG